jgi:hypothetical protein
LNGWTQGGTSNNPQAEQFDVTGLGVTCRSGVDPRRGLLAAARAELARAVDPQVPTVAYEFSADISISGAQNNAHAGSATSR